MRAQCVELTEREEIACHPMVAGELGLAADRE